MRLENKRSKSSSFLQALADPRLSSNLKDIKPKVSSTARIEFEKRVKRYYYQLTIGCGQVCTHKLCASSLTGPKLTSEAAGIMAVQLAQHPRPLFCHIPIDPNVEFIHGFTLSPFATPSGTPNHSRHPSRGERDHLRSQSVPLLKQDDDVSFGSYISSALSSLSFGVEKILDTKKVEQDLDVQEISLSYLTYDLLKVAIETYNSEEKDPAFLISCIKSVFSAPDSLAQSFCKNEALDKTSVIKSFQLIQSLEPTLKLTSILANSVEILQAKLVKRPVDDVYTRCLMILLLNPMLKDPMYHDSILKRMSNCLSRLKARKDVMVRWLSDLENDLFIGLIETFQLFVEKHVLLTGQDDGLVGAVKALSMLCHANELPKKDNKVPICKFYIPKLGEILNFKAEYKNWKRSRSLGMREFSFFNYPFLFDPICKSRIMHIDAVVQMSLHYEGAHVNQAFVIRVQKWLDNPKSVKELERDLRDVTNPYLVLDIRRDSMINDCLTQISNKRAELKKPLKIRYIGGGEEGMDQGGVQKEFFQDIMSQLLDPIYGMFTFDPETRFSWFNPSSLENVDHFELIGTMVGLALYNGVILDTNFPPCMYKKLLNEPISLNDMSKSFPSLTKGLEDLLKWDTDDIEDTFCLTFEVTFELYGKKKTIPLVPNGQDIFVNLANRQKFVSLYIDYVVNLSIKRQFDAFQKGFLSVVGGDALYMCRSSELELMLCGYESQDLDFSALEKSCKYDDGYDSQHTLIIWFWEIVHEMTLSQKKSILSFVTSSDRIPLGGLSSLTFVIQRNGPDTNRLPSSLTCFGRLLLPEYSTKEKLRERLLTAIENAHGFGLV